MTTTQRMIYQGLPENDATLSEIGRIAIRHGQLDNQLRLVVGDLLEMSRRDTLDATAREGSAILRTRILKLARKRFRDGAVLGQLQAIMERAARVTEKRNAILHTLWGHELDGAPVIRDDDHNFCEAPSTEDLAKVTAAIQKVTAELIYARLEGFLAEARKTNIKG